MNALEIYLDRELLRENLATLNSKILFANENDPINIHIPKDCVQFSSESIDIAIEYLEGAYIGERLSKVAKQIELVDILPDESGFMGFTLMQTDKAALISLLKEIVGYADWEDEDDQVDFMEKTQEFTSFAENNPIRFPKLFERYKEFAKEAEE